MEVWALEAYGAAHTLQEMLTIKSDDMMGRVQAFSALIQGNEIPGSTVPETFKLLVRKLNGLGLGLEAYSAEGTSEEETDTPVAAPEEEKVDGKGSEILDQEVSVVDEEGLESEGLEEVKEESEDL